MAKILKTALALALCATMFFGAYEKELANFDKNFATSTQKSKFHQQLRSLYIQSVVNDDEKSKKELLKRLIISSKALNLDTKAYEDELNALNLKASKTSASKDKPLFVLSSSKQENALVLRLSEPLKAKDIDKIELKERGNYRYILDFEAALDGGRKDFEFKNAKITLAQFNPKTTRLVLNSEKELDYKLEFEGKNFVLKFKEKTPAKSPNSSPQKQTQQNVAPKKPAKNATNSAKNAPKETLYILQSFKNTDGIRLALSDELDTDEIKQFSMKEKGINRIVLSFEAALDGGRKSYTFGKDSIIITQYSPKVVRVVFSSNSKFEVSKESEGKSLFLSFDKDETATNAQKSAKNSSKTKPNPTNSAKSTPKKLNTKNKVIVIDAGHGGKDGGAIGYDGKLLEKDIVLSIALKTGDELRKMGYQVFYTRTKDRYINLRDRTKLANDKRANLFISIHANAAINKSKAKTMQGVETFFLSPARSERSKEVAALENKADFEEANFFLKQNFLSALSREKIIASNRLAIDIQKNILNSVRKKYKVVDGAVREAPFWVLVGAQDMPAVLIEVGYISHNDEGKRLSNKLYQELLAKGIALGVQNYFRNNADE